MTANAILVGAAFLIALLLFELICKFGFEKNKDYRWDQRYMLVSDHKGGGVFKNTGPFFVYQKHNTINFKTYYFVKESWVKEYDYFIKTNNFGLVQTNDIQPNVPSVLLLGDSFTEGQGVSPWFETLKWSFSSSPEQFINGGILATGFQHWKLLHDYLITEGINVKTLVVIFISDDYARRAWNMPSNTIRCIADYRQCVGDENFYGISAPGELNTYLEKLRAYRERVLQRRDYSVKELFKHYLPATTFVLLFLRHFLWGGATLKSTVAPNREIISGLIDRYKGKLLFIHIPEKDEVIKRVISPVGIEARNDIKTLGGALYDGHALCGLTIADYYFFDMHPNASGYKKISTCVAEALKGYVNIFSSKSLTQ